MVVLLVYSDPVVLVLLAYPNHVLADPHQLVVQLGIHHLHLLQLEDALVAALGQLPFVLLQTLDDLQGHRATGQNHLGAQSPSHSE